MNIYFGQYVPYHLWYLLLRSVSNVYGDKEVTIYCDEWDHDALIDLCNSISSNIKITKVRLGWLHKFRRILFLFVLPKYLVISLKLLYTNKVLNKIDDVSMWELACLTLRAGEYRPKVFNLVKSGYSIFCEKIRAYYILTHTYVLGILGHKVYGSRVIWETLSNSNIRILLWGSNNFIIHSAYYDNRLPFLVPLENIGSLNDNGFSIHSAKYWTNRTNGAILYKDAAKAALQGHTSADLQFEYPRHVVMLHVFRDSPFFSLDPDRIFNDYFQWFAVTLKHISESNDKWVVRLHPSALDWGEDQIDVINASLKYLGISMPDNLMIDMGVVSNEYVFNHCDVIVTYQGSAVVEALAFGKKIISIAGYNKINNYLPNTFLVPNNVNEYINFIANMPRERFIASQKETEIGRKLLYAKEYVLSLSRYSDVTGSKRAELRSIQDEVSKGRCFNEQLVIELSDFIRSNYKGSSYEIFPKIIL